MAVYDPKSLKAEEFINHEEILATLAYAEENKRNVALIDEILDKARPVKGEKGYVIGRHSGVEHVMVHMKNPEALDRLMIGDAFRIRAHGAGMVIEGFEELCIDCIDPDLLEKFASINDEGKIEVPVAGKIPAVLMGSGIGMKSYRGDYDMITQDRALIEKLGVKAGDCLYFGDSGTDMKTGKAAGMTTVGVLWGYRTEEELVENGADLLIKKPEEIADLCRRRHEHLFERMPGDVPQKSGPPV